MALFPKVSQQPSRAEKRAPQHLPRRNGRAGSPPKSVHCHAHALPVRMVLLRREAMTDGKVTSILRCPFPGCRNQHHTAPQG